MFDDKIETIKIFGSACIAMGVKVMGGSSKHLIVLITLLIMDTIFGWLKSKKLNKWNSKAARWGAIGKIIELMFVGILYMLDWLFEVDYLKYFGIYYFGICEIASLFENYAELNGNLPKGVVELIEKTQFSIGTAIVKKVKDLISQFIDINGDDENANK